VDLESRTLRLIFRRYAGFDGTISRFRLEATLKTLGYAEAKITDMLVEQLANQVVGESTTLSYTEWKEFCVLFNTEVTVGANKDFLEADLDQSGYLGPGEVSVLLDKYGITVIPGVVRELISEVSLEKPGEVSITEFDVLMSVIRTRGGFSKKETTKLLDLFMRYDQNDSGKLDRKELKGILTWLSLSGGRSNALQRKRLAEQVLDCLQQYEGNEVVEPEFLLLMRKFRELEIAEISNIFTEFDSNGEGALSLDSACALLSDLGYLMPRPNVVEDCAAKCGLGRMRTEFYFDDILMIARCFRECEGFTMVEVEEFREVFLANDSDGSGEIDNIELGGVLRWLGNPADVETTQDLMDEVDVDNSGLVDFEEFLRVMRRFREDEVSQTETLFKDSDADASGFLSFKELKFLMLNMNYHPTEAQSKMLEETYGMKETSYEETVGFIKTLRDEARSSFQQNQGFPMAEVKRLRLKFDKLDPEGTEQIGHDDLDAVVAELFPQVASSEEVKQILSKFRTNTDNIKFPEFLRLVRMVADRAGHPEHLRHKQTAKDAGFTSWETTEILKIFKLCDANSAHVVNTSELKEMLVMAFPLFHEQGKDEPTLDEEGEEEQAVLDKLLEQLTDSGDNGGGRPDFAEFVALIRSALDAKPKSEPGSECQGSETSETERSGSKDAVAAGPRDFFASSAGALRRASAGVLGVGRRASGVASAGIAGLAKKDKQSLSSRMRITTS